MESNICRNCRIFFGCQEGLCSKCFKESKAREILSNIIESPAVQVPKPLIPEEKKEPIIPQDSGKCAHCSKRMGPVSFRCKCSLFFCTRHRLPEEHSCNFDHKAVGIRKLSEDNPIVQAPKFNKLE